MAATRKSSSEGSTSSARSDAYVGILFVSLLAQIIGVVFFYLDWSQYPESKPKAPPAIQAPAAGGGGAPAPAPPAGGPAGAPPPVANP